MPGKENLITPLVSSSSSCNESSWLYIAYKNVPYFNVSVLSFTFGFQIFWQWAYQMTLYQKRVVRIKLDIYVLKDTKGVIRIHEKTRQHNGQNKKTKEQQSTKHYTGMNFGRVSNSCSASDTRRVTLVTKPVISYGWGLDRKVVMTSGTYPWSLVTQVLCIGNHVMVLSINIIIYRIVSFNMHYNNIQKCTIITLIWGEHRKLSSRGL
jgi:hypothetical protein